MVLLTVFVLSVSAFSLVESEEPWVPAKAQCEKITIPMCQDLGYNLTVMPNLMENGNQKEAERGVIKFNIYLFKTSLSRFSFFDVSPRPIYENCSTS